MDNPSVICSEKLAERIPCAKEKRSYIAPVIHVFIRAADRFRQNWESSCAASNDLKQMGKP
ncbi:hypothetical protein LCM19_04110 [Qipengyuania flava]|uniref:hypothetical protein n=1 Tax=Qipengyuania aestuarii TaxID=2867241 RepID=UPI001C878398|nr:hypothetical protein [Qipengyuania aestuarii]MBX7534273.1 hypothetical protein [Qipengyuania aestuarii]MCA0977542.1 hypothetical protein [Qipengyuania flava]